MARLNRRQVLSWGTIGLLGLGLLAAATGRASPEALAGLFATGDYDGAREVLASTADGFRPGEEAFWASRLERDPARAAVTIRETLEQVRLPEAARTRLILDLADIEYARGQYAAAFQALEPLLETGQPGSLPGEVYLQAGLSLRATGNLQVAREMLASVRPQDPAFLLARYYLGDIGLEQNDASLALKYFESAERDADTASTSRLGAGIWRAHVARGEDDQADKVVEQLKRQDPGGLALLEIQRRRRDRTEEMEAMVAEDAPSESTVTTPAATGRYALQLGAFSDRRLALEFHKRYRSELPDLRIDQVRDERGQFLYKVRTGAFVNPALARTEARRLADRLDIEVIVSDLTGSAGPSD